MSNVGRGDGSGLVELPLPLARLRRQNMAGARVPSHNLARGGELEALGSAFVRLQFSSRQIVLLEKQPKVGSSKSKVRQQAWADLAQRSAPANRRQAPL